ncbi:hypothetical protein [Actinocorallia herbida]|uniref:hypothetical protein n=1 Tax=Actinocorallia herbida TaxID=58109 RepID=UPI000F4C9BA7|nr:hypothetical protein [Actinocorallia herbida]
MTGVVVGGPLSGSVVGATVFSRQGLGRLATSAVAQQDLAVQGMVLLGAAVYALSGLLVDLEAPLPAPRIAAARRGPSRPTAAAFPDPDL